jgi:polyisoprenyl-teichoic acid--peptidoglycan teichoic acid transferase
MSLHGFRRPQNKQRFNSLDGMVAGGFAGQRRPFNGSQLRQTAARRSTRQIDDFHRRGGHATTSAIGFQAAPRAPSRHTSVNTANILNANAAAQPKKGRFSGCWRRFSSKSALSMMALTLIAGGFLAGKAYLNARQIFKGGAAGAAALQEGVDPNLLRGEGDGRVNILVLGKGGPGHDGADLTDTLLIASIDPIQKEASLLSVPRDLFIDVPELGGMKVNSIYATAKQQALTNSQASHAQTNAENAGLDAVQRSLETAMGIPIHYYAMVDFTAFRQAIDTVGGVDIDVAEQLYDPSIAWENGNNPIIANQGHQTFHGRQALLYARSRYGSARGDFDRNDRQRQIILGLKDKVLSLGTYGNPLKIAQLADAFGSHVQTNLNLNEVKRLHELAQGIASSRVASIGLADEPNSYVTTDMVAGQSVVVPRAGLNDFSEIQYFVRNSLRDSFLRKEDAKILVLNGTATPGRATAKSEELRSFGYNVISAANAPTSNYNNTLLIDLRGGVNKYTRRYLEQRLQLAGTNNLPDSNIQPGEADFVIIIGQN